MSADRGPTNTAFDGQFEIPTLQELIDLVKQQANAKSRVIGIYPETKHPTHFKSIGLPFERRLVNQLSVAGYRGKDAAVYIQSFETAGLKEIRGMTDMRIVQLIDNPLNPPAPNGTPRKRDGGMTAASGAGYMGFTIRGALLPAKTTGTNASAGSAIAMAGAVASLAS